MVARAKRVLAVARADADVSEVVEPRIHRSHVRRVIEPARVDEGRYGARRAAQLSDHPAGDEVGGGLPVRNVEPPDLATHVGRVHTVREAVAVEVDDTNTGRHRVAHATAARVESLGGAGRVARVPEQRSSDGIDDIDRVADHVGRQRAVVLVGLIAARDHEHGLQRVLRRTGDVDVCGLRLGP